MSRWLLAVSLLVMARPALAVTIKPQGARPRLLSGPGDKADIQARLAILAYPTSDLLNAYLSGTEADKQAQTTAFFGQLYSDYTTQMGRRLVEDLFEFDIAVAMGYATSAQQQTLRDRTVYWVQTKFPTFPDAKPGGGNLWLEDCIALGAAALTFPDEPGAQTWIDASVRWTQQEIQSYFHEGAGIESPRYHDWVMSLLGKYLIALRRCTDADLWNEPALRDGLEWFIRYSSPPVSVGSAPYTIPAWGDSNYGDIYYNLPIFAAGYAVNNPDFSTRLMRWWRQTGSATSGGWDFGTTLPQIFDPRLADTPLATPGSTYGPYMGQAVLRAETGGSNEFWATFNCGSAGITHANADNGHIDLFAFGVPLALDSMSGPYDDSNITWNRQTMAHNTVRCVPPPESQYLRWSSGTFQAFGSSTVADYAVGDTLYSSTSIRQVVMVKPDYMVVWDQITATQYSDWFFHSPAQTLEWQAHKVISHTPWNVDLDIHFLLPSNSLPAPTLPSENISTDYTTTNWLASAVPAPTTATLYTGQGDGRFGEWGNPNDSNVGRDPFALKWQKYLFVRSPAADGDYLTILHPRKVGVTPALTATLNSSSSTSVSLTVNYNGRTDTITINTSGATITKGGEPTVQFTKTYPQSGVTGPARYIKSDGSTNTLSSALVTTGEVDVTIGTLVLGNNNYIPNTVPVIIRPGGTLDLANRTDTVGRLTVDGGALIGTGTLTVTGIDWYGGKITANVTSSGSFTKKGGASWSPSTNVQYAGDTTIEAGALVFQAGSPNLPGRLTLNAGATLDLNGTARTFSTTNLIAAAGSTITTGAGTLTLIGANNLTLTASFSGNLVHAGTGLLTIAGNLGTNTTLTVQSGAALNLGAQTIAGLTAATASTVTLAGNLTLGTATLNGTLSGAGMLVSSGNLQLAATASVAGGLGLGLTGAGQLNLANGATFTVAWLSIDGVLQQAGTWNATRDPGHFSGTGNLIVTQGLTAPTGLSATASNNVVNLSWPAVAGASGYSVKRTLQSGGPYTPVSPVAGTSYSDATGTEAVYFYVITAVNGVGESANSPEAHVATINGGQFTAPILPGARLWLDATRDDTITFGSGAVSYWYDARGNGNYASQTTVANRGTYHTDAALPGPAQSVVDFGTFSSSAGEWMQFNTEITDIRSVHWVVKSTMQNHLLGSTTTYYPFHTGGNTIWSSANADPNVKNGTTWLNGTVTNGVTSPLPADYCRVGVTTTGNVRANALARDRTYRYGALQYGELIIFNTPLTETQRLDVDSYLNYKWWSGGAGVGNRIPSDTAVTLLNGAVLDLSGQNYQTLAGLSATDGLGSKVRLGAASLVISNAASVTFDGMITGAGGSVVKTGAGTFTLTGTNTFNGGLTITGGPVNAIVNAGFNSLGSGTVTVGAAATLTVNNTATASGATTTIANPMTGSGRLAVNFAAGTSARNTYLTGVSGFAGTVELANAGSTGDKWSLALTGAAPATLQINNGSQLYVSGGSFTFNAITVTGTGNSENLGAIRLGAGTLGGDITLTGSTTIGAGGGTITGAISCGIAGTQTLTFGGSAAGNATITGNITGGAGTMALTKLQTGRLTLSGNNNIGGQVQVSDSGTLEVIGGVSTFGNGLLVNNVNNTGATSTFSMAGGSVTVSNSLSVAQTAGVTGGGTGRFLMSGGSFTVASGSVYISNYGTGSMTISVGTFATAGVTYLGLRRSATLTVSGGFVDLQELRMGYYGSGTPAVTSIVNLDGGTLKLRNLTSTADDTEIFNFNGGTLQAAASFTSGGSISTVVKSGGAIIETLAGNTVTFTTALTAGSPSGGLTKLGTGTLTLAAVNTYTGATTVSNGTFQLTGSVTGPVTIAGGATLAGTGTINNNLVINPGATIVIQLPGNPLTVAGDLTLAGTLNITDAGGFGVGTYTLITHAGALTNNGLTIGTVPNASLVYQLDTNVTGQVRLVVLTRLAAWQLQYFGCTNCPAALPDADPLGKGMSNTNQFLAGLNPTNAASVFRITNVQRTGNDFAVTWKTAGVRTNILQVSTGNLTNFVDLPASLTILPISGDATTNYLDPGGVLSSTSRFYRVRLVP